MSPYDLARLYDDYPAVFDEYADMFFDAKSARKHKSDIEARKARVSRIFNRRRK